MLIEITNHKHKNNNNITNTQELNYRVKHFTKNGKTIELHNTDCLTGMDTLPDKHFDVVVTSPPYNLGIQYNSYNDDIPRNKYLEWIEKVVIMIKQKMKDDGSFFLNIGSSPTNPSLPFEIASVLSSHLTLQNTIHWIKSIYIENESYGNKVSLNIGHYKPINSNRFLNDNHEYIFHFTKSGNIKLVRLAIGVPYKDVGNINRWKRKTAGENSLRCRGNCWYIPYKTIRSRDKERPHPATFPIEIPENCIKLHSITNNNEMVVLDPFMDIGATSLASYKLGINCVGFETDTNYFDTNIQLLEDEFAVKTLDSWK